MAETEAGYITFDEAQRNAMAALPQDAPMHMLNLIRLRERADYPADHPNHGKGLSGLEAYRAYGRESAPFLAKAGGRQVWLGRAELLAIGPGEERWDLAFIAEYPDFQAFTAMLQDPGYQKAVVNRRAAITDSRLIRCEPLEAGPGFGLTIGD